MKKLVSFLTLFTSASTLICCALPALFVTLGFGAAFAGFAGNMPGLIWLSEHKAYLFGIGAVLLLAGGLLRRHSQQMSCPTDPKLAEACAETKDWSGWIYWSSVVLYGIGFFFAYVAPHLMSDS